VAQSSRTTFAKRQKEQARKEKARMKAEKRLQKKLDPGSQESDFMDQDGNPIFLDAAGNRIPPPPVDDVDNDDDDEGDEPRPPV
jgi:hypothetical protein